MHRRKTLYLLGVWLVSAVMLGATALPSTNRAGAQDAGRYYPETGKTLAPEFISYYDSHGGLPIFGYPLTDPETEGGFKVQYLERARLEYHPEHAGTEYEVQLGLLGNIVTAGRQFPAAADARASTSDRQYFPETNHTLAGPFLAYWQSHGGLAMFGYPISEPVDENGVTAQYFERNRFEYHPENAGTDYEVLLGLLGRDVLAQRVQIKETAVDLPTYGYEQALAVTPGDAIAPYPRLDTSRVTPPTMKTYRLIVLENHYLRLSVLPEVGGRLYEVVYKPTGHDELYKNPVIKPSSFGIRGWWLGAGGTEWAAPTEEHGLMEYLPWDATTARDSDGGASVTVSAVDRLTGMKVSVNISLKPEEDAYSVSPRMDNITSSAARGQLWSNAMVSPGGTNKAPGGTRFIIPTTQMIVHSTSDPGVPIAHSSIGWPVQGDRDLSNTATWHGWFGGFAPLNAQRGQFAAVYNPAVDEGLVKTFTGSELPGLKIFGFGPGFNTHVYTDDDSSYVELWGGITPTFWDNRTFQPGAGAGWTERWQPVANTGGVSLANSWGMVSLQGGVASVLPVRRAEGLTLVLSGPNGETRKAVNAYPDKPGVVNFSGSVHEIEVIGPDGHSLLKGAPVH